MPVGATMGSQLASEARETSPSGDRDYKDLLEFRSACFALSALNDRLALIGGDPSLTRSHIGMALDGTISVLESIADRLEAQASNLRSWNVEAAGRNEIIRGEIDRNWVLVEQLKTDLADE